MQQDAAMEAVGGLPPVPSERLAALQHLRTQLQGMWRGVLRAAN